MIGIIQFIVNRATDIPHTTQDIWATSTARAKITEIKAKTTVQIAIQSLNVQ